MKTGDIVKQKIRREGFKIVGIGLAWSAATFLLWVLGVLDCMIFSERRGLIGLLIHSMGFSVEFGGPLIIAIGIYQWVTGNRTRAGKGLFGELLTQQERAEHITAKEKPDQPHDKYKASDSCPFCASTSLTHVGEENHCEACGAIWKVMAPMGTGAAIVCILLALLPLALVVQRIGYWLQGERQSALWLLAIIAAIALAVAFLWGAYSILKTRNQDKGIKIVVVRKPNSEGR